jgi:biopolymer transport protein ExbD
LPETTVRLKAVMVNAPDRPVIIAPSGTTRHQRVMDVLNLCKAVHVRNITFGSNLD